MERIIPASVPTVCMPFFRPPSARVVKPFAAVSKSTAPEPECLSHRQSLASSPPVNIVSERKSTLRTTVRWPPCSCVSFKIHKFHNHKTHGTYERVGQLLKLKNKIEIPTKSTGYIPPFLIVIYKNIYIFIAYLCHIAPK